MSHGMIKPTRCHVHPAKAQVSPGVHPVLHVSEPCCWHRGTYSLDAGPRSAIGRAPDS